MSRYVKIFVAVALLGLALFAAHSLDLVGMIKTMHGAG